MTWLARLMPVGQGIRSLAAPRVITKNSEKKGSQLCRLTSIAFELQLQIVSYFPYGSKGHSLVPRNTGLTTDFKYLGFKTDLDRLESLTPQHHLMRIKLSRPPRF